MKKFALIFLLFFAASTYSQNQVIVKLTQPPPNKLGIAELWSLELVNTTGREIRAYAVGTVSEARDGLILEATSKLFTIKPGRNVYTYRDFPNADVRYSNTRYRDIILRTGNAPDGDYTICITVFNEKDEVIAQENCISHSVRTLGNITLISPADGEELLNGDEKEFHPIVFSWSPLPNAKEYSLKIVEVLGNQSPQVAIKNNRPFFEKDGIRTNTFQYPASERKFEQGKTYAWQVYLKENPEATASEVWTFKISRISKTPELITETSLSDSVSLLLEDALKSFSELIKEPIGITSPTIVNNEKGYILIGGPWRPPFPFPLPPVNQPVAITIKGKCPGAITCPGYTYLGRLVQDAGGRYMLEWHGEKGTKPVRVPAEVTMQGNVAGAPSERAKAKFSWKLIPPKIDLIFYWEDPAFADARIHIVADLPPDDLPGRKFEKKLDIGSNISAYESKFSQNCCGRPKPFPPILPPVWLLREDLIVAAVPYDNPKVKNARDIEEIAGEDIGFVYIRKKPPLGPTTTDNCGPNKVWCPPDQDPFLNLRLVRNESGSSSGNYAIQFTKLDNPKQVIATLPIEVEYTPNDNTSWVGIEDRIESPDEPAVTIKLSKFKMNFVMCTSCVTGRRLLTLPDVPIPDESTLIELLKPYSRPPDSLIVVLENGKAVMVNNLEWATTEISPSNQKQKPGIKWCECKSGRHMCPESWSCADCCALLDKIFGPNSPYRVIPRYEDLPKDVQAEVDKTLLEANLKVGGQYTNKSKQSEARVIDVDLINPESQRMTVVCWVGPSYNCQVWRVCYDLPNGNTRCIFVVRSGNGWDVVVERPGY